MKIQNGALTQSRIVRLNEGGEKKMILKIKSGNDNFPVVQIESESFDDAKIINIVLDVIKKIKKNVTVRTEDI